MKFETNDPVFKLADTAFKATKSSSPFVRLAMRHMAALLVPGQDQHRRFARVAQVALDGMQLVAERPWWRAADGRVWLRTLPS